jgi:hypothetical protein
MAPRGRRPSIRIHYVAQRVDPTEDLTPHDHNDGLESPVTCRRGVFLQRLNAPPAAPNAELVHGSRGRYCRGLCSF